MKQGNRLVLSLCALSCAACLAACQDLNDLPPAQGRAAICLYYALKSRPDVISVEAPVAMKGDVNIKLLYRGGKGEHVRGVLAIGKPESDATVHYDVAYVDLSAEDFRALDGTCNTKGYVLVVGEEPRP